MALPPLGDRREVVGAVHVHTRHSDGGSTTAEVIAAAAENGLDFVVIADHDTLRARESGEEGWHGKVLVAAASEISTRRNYCHLVALGQTTTVPRFSLTVCGAFERIRDEGGAVLLAHADGRGLGGKGPSRQDWPYWSHPYLSGAEIWSYLQDWGTSFRLLRPSSYRLDLVAERIKGPPDWLLGYWDAEAEVRPFAGLGASDNHAKRLFPFRRCYFPHGAIIGRLVDRVRLDEPLSSNGSEAARQILRALAAGRAIFARDELASSEGFDFRAELADGRVLRSGQSAEFAPGARLVIESPVEAELRVCRRGEVVASATGKRLEHRPEGPGAYRAEGRLNGKAWAFSNHVRLVEQARAD